MTNFGEGPALKDACPWLKDTAERHRRILDVTERNSVIEGLPPMTRACPEALCSLYAGIDFARDIVRLLDPQRKSGRITTFPKGFRPHCPTPVGTPTQALGKTYVKCTRRDSNPQPSVPKFKFPFPLRS